MLHTSVDDAVQHPVFIDAELANRLKVYPGTSEGIRYDKHKKAYVEMEGGMVMVRKGRDGYRQTHAQEPSPTGDPVEQIPGSHLWRQIVTDDAPSKRSRADADLAAEPESEATTGPSKRARLSDESHVTNEANALVENLYAQQSSAIDLSAGQWKNWARTQKPESGESVEIEGKHYLIVPKDLRPETELVYLQHPGFVPDRFDAFEQMLRQEPDRQPKWALKRDGQWKVLEIPPFAMPPSQYVSTAFNYLSDHSTAAIARAVFDRVSLPDGINSDGLSTMALTFRHWLDRVNNESPMRDLSDPLVMLPRLPVQPDPLVAGGILTLPPRDSVPLQRLDFDPQRFPLEWGVYTAAPTAASLRTLFSTVLQHNGYSVNPTPRQHKEAALIFHRQGVAAIFVLRLPRITGDTVLRKSIVGSEVTSAEFLNRFSAAEKEKLNSHLARGEVINLVGGVQLASIGTPTLFMVREG
ncbi:hypothetical protein [Pseudomonas sp. A34-9]|uniref:hypothetical protein n=1 Tax=Pseudomonas sp. A34-9 TaxID=3034675 RepID=UPI00240E979E|nr:hypothetical protein [Pseudomonas sp. A34-9]